MAPSGTCPTGLAADQASCGSWRTGPVTRPRRERQPQVGAPLGANTQIVESSPNQARLDSDGISIVVGSRGNGCVYAVHLSNGTTTPGWPKCTDAGIDSTPSVYAPTGGLDDVFVTTGDTPGEQPPVYNENCGSEPARLHREHLRVRSRGQPAVGPRPSRRLRDRRLPPTDLRLADDRQSRVPVSPRSSSGG